MWVGSKLSLIQPFYLNSKVVLFTKMVSLYKFLFFPFSKCCGSLTTAQGSVTSSRSVNQSTFVPEIHFSEIMKSNSSLTMNRIASYVIAAVIQMSNFFLEDSPTFFCIRMLIITIENDSGDKSNVTCNWGSQKSRFTKRSPRSSRFAK